MKKRMKVIKLLDKFSIKDSVPKVVIKGSQTGLTLYEGSLFHVPYGSCCDYVLSYTEQDGVLEIVTTCSPY